jgi:WD40 repeat protein
VATGDGDSQVILWDVNTCQQTATLIRRNRFITDLAFDPDNTSLLVVEEGARETLIRWNFHTGAEYIFPEQWGRVVSVTLPPLGQVVVTAGVDGRLVIWDKTFTKKLHILPTSCRGVPHLSLVSRNGRIATCCGPRSTIIWDLIKMINVCEYNGSLMNSVSSICLAPNGDYLVITGCVFTHEPGVIEIIDATSGRLLRTLRAHQAAACSSAISPDGRFLATGGGEDHSVIIWPLNDVATPLK